MSADLRVWVIIVMITVMVVIMRNVFLFAPRSWQPRGLLQQALRYAPLAALAALVTPQMLAGVRAQQGALGPELLADPRLASALVLIAVIRLSGNAFAGIAAGTGIFLLFSR